MSEQWIPVRFLRLSQTCRFCQARIAAGSPGPSGTRCWFEKVSGDYECLDCRTEAARAEEAMLALAALKNRAGPWDPKLEADVLVNRAGWIVWGQRRAEQAYGSGGQAALDALVVMEVDR